MSSALAAKNQVFLRRRQRGWSQQQLADRAGLSRAGVSAVESGRLAPSVHAALALARALECSVEALFARDTPPPRALDWAVSPPTDAARYWLAKVGSGRLAYPIADDSPQLEWHDGVFRDREFHETGAGDVAERTLVVAGCDPAAGLLAAEYARQFQFRMIVLRRGSRAALLLLAAGKVHAAGLHLGDTGRASQNARVARQVVGGPCSLVRVARWDEGLAVSPHCKTTSVRALGHAKTQWVGREEGSGARQCQDEVLGSRPSPRRIAFDHASVTAAIKCGWADVGPCVRIASEEAGLRFLKIKQKDYDLCFASDAKDDPRIAALLATLRSRAYRQRLAELPGYRTPRTGELVD